MDRRRLNLEGNSPETGSPCSKRPSRPGCGIDYSILRQEGQPALDG